MDGKELYWREGFQLKYFLRVEKTVSTLFLLGFFTLKRLHIILLVDFFNNSEYDIKHNHLMLVFLTLLKGVGHDEKD